MRQNALQYPPEARERPGFVRQAECESVPVPICLGGIRRELPASPGRYLILLRQRHNTRINRPWNWGGFVAGL